MKRENFRIDNVNIVDVVNGKILENQTLYVRDGKICEEFEDIKSVYDANGCYLVPGLINMHAHLFGTGKPSNAVNAKGDSQKTLVKFVQSKLGQTVVNLLVRKSLKTELLSGTTTVRGVGDLVYSDIHERDQINKGKYLGSRLYCSGPAICPVGGHGDNTISKSCVTKEDYENAVLDRYNRKADLIKIMITSGVMDAKSPDAPDLVMSEKEVKWVCDKAHSLGLKVAAHVETQEGVITALKGGVDTVEHGGVFNDEIVELFKKTGSSLTCTISPALPYGEFDSSLTHCTEIQTKVAKYVANGVIEGAKGAIKYNVPLGLGTDAACPYAFQYGMWRELQYLHKCCGVENKECLRLATIGNAKILGIDSFTGSIEKGKMADMFIVHGNPFEDLHVLSRPIVVFKEGYAIKNPKIKKYEELDLMLDELSD